MNQDQLMSFGASEEGWKYREVYFLLTPYIRLSTNNPRLRRHEWIEGVEVNSPRQALRKAFEIGYIEDIDVWFEMLEDRNMTSHTYDPDIADKVYESAKRLPAEIRKVLQILAVNESE